MIVSPGRGYIFVHIPKTGGTSLAQALEARAHKDDILIGDTPKARKRRPRLRHLTPRGRLWKHSTLADIDGVLTPQQISAMFCVTLVRNPWDRAVSYYHWLQDQSFAHPAVALAQALPFQDFLRHDHTVASLKAWPAARYMRDVTGTERATLYIRLEHMAEDMAPFAKHLGFQPDVPHLNRSDRAGHYRAFYTPDLAEHLAQICQEDIKRFNYSF